MADVPEEVGHPSYLEDNPELDLNLLKAVQSGRYLVVIAYVCGDGVLHYYRNTLDFPVDNFSKVERTFREDGDRERAK